MMWPNKISLVGHPINIPIVSVVMLFVSRSDYASLIIRSLSSLSDTQSLLPLPATQDVTGFSFFLSLHSFHPFRSIRNKIPSLLRPSPSFNQHRFLPLFFRHSARFFQLLSGL